MYTLKNTNIKEITETLNNGASVNYLEDIIFDLLETQSPLLHIGNLTTTFNTVPWTEFLALSYLIFMIGLIGIIFNFKNFLVTMFSVELMYLGITISFILVSVVSNDPKGQIYAMILLILAAAESAIGLGILIVLFRFGKSIDFESYQELKG
jgi:NADH-quinone oxidoreductase subunit K